MDVKHCRTCGTELKVGKNWTLGAAKKRDYICRSCRSTESRAYRVANSEQENARRRAYHADNREQENIRNGARGKVRRGKRGAILRRYKRMKGCAVCGERRTACLDFHAPNGHKEVGVRWDG